MKKTESLFLGFNDAENFKKREHKKMFEKFFTRTNDLHELVKPHKYFLLGDKGTGKTALSVYLSNSDFQNTSSSLSYIRETDYLKFVTLKKEKHLSLSDYQDIWKVILYILIAKQIQSKERDNVIFSKFSKFKPLKDAIEDFYKKAFSPEIIYALNFVEDSRRAAEILHEYFKVGAESTKSESFSESRFQINILYIQKQFETALSSLNLESNHIIFIDGIDIRPRNVEYEEYLECVKGLVSAVWSLNNDFLANIKGSKGRLKVVLLLRPDIFASLGLQNLNNKIADNSVLLDWKTTYPKYRNSDIFKMIDNIINSQQSKFEEHGKSWDFYFPYETKVFGKSEDSFISFLRFSMFKPRDIISMLNILQENFKNDENRKFPVFIESDFSNTEFRNKYSEYLLGEIKDFLAFYHSDKDYELFLKFFEFLNGKTKFNYDEYIVAFDDFADYVEKNDVDIPIFFESSDNFLQFMYQLNVICYIEDTENSAPFIHWCFRERSYANLNPKIKNGVRYEIHYGLSKAFNIGKKLKKRTIRKRNK
jgi:adenylate kinase family enzyme